MGDGLHGFGQLTDLIPVLGVSRRDMQGQQVAKRIDRQMNFGPPLSLGSVVARVRRWSVSIAVRLSWMAADGVRSTALGRSVQAAQVMDHGLKTAPLNPTLCLLIKPGPRAGNHAG